MKKLFAKIFASRRPSGKIDFTHVQSILINPVGPGLGDGIVLTAAINQLRTTYPNAKIGVIRHDRNECIFKSNPLHVELIKHSIFYALTHRNKWQLFLDYSPQFTTKGIVFSFLLNFKYVICFEKEKKKYYNTNSVRNYNDYVTDLDKIHLSKSLLLTCLKKYLQDTSSNYVLPPLVKRDEIEILKFIKKDKLNVMVCPFGTTRQLDPEEFKAIFKLALEGDENKFHLLFPNNEQSPKYLLENSSILQTILPRQTVSQWCYLISQVDLVIAVDSAAVHLASAYKRPLVAFYGGKQPFIQFSPLPYSQAMSIAPIHTMPKNFNGTMKGYDYKGTAAKIKSLILQQPLFQRS